MNGRFETEMVNSALYKYDYVGIVITIPRLNELYWKIY